MSVVLATLLAGCGSGSQRETLRENLRNHRHVAVVEMDLRILSEQGLVDLASESFVELMNEIGVMNGNLRTENERMQDRLREHSISLINQNFASRGFLPIQHARIQAILKEQAAQQSGLIANPTRIGQLARADAILTGQITIRRSGGFGFIPEACACVVPDVFLERTELIFSAEITSVERGYVLFAASKSYETGKLTLGDLEELIGLWFEEIPML
ncbi:MAG: hypothetical protein KDK27_14740 [Leptospiraceae bacterium]|nr:hypothetical protein [Leptospiraceae bacterium]